MYLTKHRDERWYRVTDGTRDTCIEDKARSLGEALEVGVRYLNFGVKSTVQVWECFGGSGGYSSVEILWMQNQDGGVLISNPRGK